MMAAIAASSDLDVVLLEKNSSLGRKLLLTGGGRCNITNAKPIKKLLNSFKDKNFLKHSFYTLTNEKLLAIFEDKGLAFKEEENNRVFPESDDAHSVLDILEDYLKSTEVIYNYNVLKIEKRDKFIINEDIVARRVIIATGGCTYPQTGSDGSGYKLTSQPLSEEIRPGLAPLLTDYDLSDFAGITLYDVVVKYDSVSTRGNVLISHVGLTGPAILDISNFIDFKKDKIAIDLCPNFTQDQLREKFLKDFQTKGKTLLKNYLKFFLTNKFIDFFLKITSVDGDTKLSNVSKKNKNRIINSLKNFEFTITDFNKDLSKITVGGIATENINSKTMESTLTEGLYFAGEILAPAGPTGGYNLKLAFSTGYLAGLSACESLKNI